MGFADLSIGACAGSVEIAQGRKVNYVRARRIFQGLLYRQLGAPVGVDGVSGMRLAKRQALRRAIDCAGGRKNERSASVGLHRRQDIEGAGDIIVPEFHRIHLAQPNFD